MAKVSVSGTLHVAGLIVFLSSLSPACMQEFHDSDLASSMLNCTTTDNFVSFHPTNASSLEDAKTPQNRLSNNERHNRDDYQPDRRFNNQRLDRYSSDEQFNGNYGNQMLDKHTADRNIERYHEVQPFNRHLDEQQSNKQFSDHKLNQNNNNQDIDKHFIDPQTDTYSSNQQLRTNYDDDMSNRHLDSEELNKPLPVRPLDISSNNKKQNINSGNHQPQENVNTNFPNHHTEDKQINNNYHNQQSNKDFENMKINKNSENISLDTYSEGQQINRFSSDYNLNKNHDLQSQEHIDDRYLDRRIDKIQPWKHDDDQYYNKNINDNSDNRYIERNHKDEIVNRNPVDQHPITHLEDRSFNRHLDSLQPDRRLSEQNFERHLIDQYIDKHISSLFPDKNNNDQNSDRRLFDHQFDRIDDSNYRDNYRDSKVEDKNYRNNLQANKRIQDQHFEEHVTEQQIEKHLEDQHQNKFTDDIRNDKRLGNSNFEERLAKPNFEKNHENSEKSLDNPNFERRLGTQTLDKDSDNVQPDRQLGDPVFERHLVDPQPDRHPGGEIHSDKRLGDEHYARYGIKQNINKPKEDERTKVEPDQLNPERRIVDTVFHEYTTTEPRRESNMSHLMTFSFPKDWEESRPKLIFPNKTGHERYRMASLHLDRGLFVFDFLRVFLSIIQPRNVPLDLLKDTLEGRVNISTFISQSIHLEIIFLTVITIFVILMFVVPSTECYLCCRMVKYNYQRESHFSSLFFLSIFTIVMGTCIVTMLVCNEQVAGGIERYPETMEAALQDLRDYHSGTAMQLRKCLTRSLDVASEAILADLDNVEELLGKPVQAQLSSETGVDVALDSLMDVANVATHELAFKTDALLKKAERMREYGNELSRDCDEIRRDLERAAHDCSVEDRSLCAVIDPSGLHLALRLDRVARDDRLLRLRSASRDNLTEASRQARGEYLYVPHHVARTTLEARNLIRREINTARAKVSDEARSIEATGSDLSGHLDTVRRLNDQIVPYVRTFERVRWYVGFGTSMFVLLIWLLLFGALCCRCGCSEARVRPTLLWFAFLSVLVSLCLWLVLMAALTVASHSEMLLCRPLDDPEYRTVEAILETRVFLGRRLSVSLKDIFQKCEQNDPAYQSFQHDNNMKLEQITSHWSWSGLTRAFAKLKVDLTGLRILPPNLRELLQNLLYASAANLTEHRVMIQGPILNKDLNALSDQVENVARQLSERRTARTFQTLAAQMRDLLSRRVKPLMKMQDELVYQLAALELHLQPIQRKANHTLVQLRDVQYHIDNQGDKIAQLKTKHYVDRLSSYLDQWRAHVLTEMSSGTSKCRPLWDILRGIKLLFCSHILGPLNGFWFASLICAITLLICTPMAHNLASSYWRQPSSRKGSILLPLRQGSPDTVVMERETWRSPDPPPSMDSW